MTIKTAAKSAVLAACLPVLLLADWSPEAPLDLSLVRDASAIVGAPATPVSAAGVARRAPRVGRGYLPSRRTMWISFGSNSNRRRFGESVGRKPWLR